MSARTAACLLACLATTIPACERTSQESTPPCPGPGVLDKEIDARIEGPVAELVLVGLPRVELFPAVGPGTGWGVERVDLVLDSAERLDLALSEDGTLSEESKLLGRVDGETVVSLTGPTPPGHLLLVRPPDPFAGSGAARPLRVQGRVRAKLAERTCIGLDPSVVALRSPPSRCGNGRLEAGEACDDGNEEPDDGCQNCTVTAARCSSGDHGAGALAPWVCTGEPSDCRTLDCSLGSAPQCVRRVRVTVAAVVNGRALAETPVPLRIVGDLACPGPGTDRLPGAATCSADWPACTAVSLEAVPDAAARLLGWSGGCRTTGSSCRIDGAPSDVLAVATTNSPETAGFDWVRALPMEVQQMRVGAGPGGHVAVAAATTVSSVTMPDAGGFVHRRATQLMVLGPEGRVHFDRRLGGRAGHVQPHATAALGDGGALLVASFPRNLPILPLDSRRRPPKTPRRAQTGQSLRLIRFSSAGDPAWMHELGKGETAVLTMTDASAFVAVSHESSGTDDETTVFAIDPRGERQWQRTLPGRRPFALAPHQGGVRLLGRRRASDRSSMDDGSTALSLVELEAEGASKDPIVLNVEATSAASLGIDLGPERIMVVTAEPKSVSRRMQSITLRAFGEDGRPLWQQTWDAIDVCRPPVVQADATGGGVVLHGICGTDGSPAGFVVDRFEADGRARWRERVGSPAPSARGIRPLAVDVDEAGHVVIAGRQTDASALGHHPLPAAGAFVTRLRP